MARITVWVKQLSISLLACVFCLTNGCVAKQETKCSSTCCGSCAGQAQAAPRDDQKNEDSSANADLSALTDKEMSQLKNVWTDPTSGKQLSFEIEFKPYLPTAPERVEQPNSTGLQFIVTGILIETKNVEGKAFQRQITGDKVHICVTHKKGNIVLNTTAPLVKLCPVCGGGYIGEVAKPGEYTAVVWITNSMTGKIGQKVTATLK